MSAIQIGKKNKIVTPSLKGWNIGLFAVSNKFSDKPISNPYGIDP
jgi:hypothetical protein